MGVKAMMFAMVAGSAAVIGFGRRDRTPAPPPAHERTPEKPWLSKEAAAELIDMDGGPGLLFSGIGIGGPAPTGEQRARIDEFARRNNVEINFEIRDHALAAIRASVTYGGCCGYEGADVLALRLGHPHTGGCTQPDTWIDDWAYAKTDGVHVHAAVHVNRVDVRWEHTTHPGELIERADELLGMNADKVRLVSGDRWLELGPHRYLIEMPMPYPSYPWRDDQSGIEVSTHAGKIVEVSIRISGYYDESLGDAMVAQWGQPHVGADDTRTWRRYDRTITANGDNIVISSGSTRSGS